MVIKKTNDYKKQKNKKQTMTNKKNKRLLIL
jgi:hypothetical protein